MLNNNILAPFISVIIPMYNAENFIIECLESLIISDISLEIIVINDGSTDRSFDIVNNFAKKESRIKLIGIPNSGPSNARNIGIENATGEWLTFVDADDKIEPGYLSIPSKDIYGDVDVVVAAHKRLYASGEMELQSYDNSGEKINKSEELKKLQSQLFDLNARKPKNKISFSWGKFYKSQIIKENNLRFPTEISYCEDTVFLYYVLSYANNVIFVQNEEPRYIYREVPTSITNRKSLSTFQRRLSMIEYVHNNLLSPQNRNTLAHFYLEQFNNNVNLLLVGGYSLGEIYRNLFSLYSLEAYKWLSKFPLKSKKTVFSSFPNLFLLFKTKLIFPFLIFQKLKK